MLLNKKPLLAYAGNMRICGELRHDLIKNSVHAMVVHAEMWWGTVNLSAIGNTNFSSDEYYMIKYECSLE